MRLSLRHLALVVPVTLFVAACSDDDDATGPTPSQALVEGMLYTARVDLIQNVLYPNKAPAFFQIVATLQSQRDIPLDRTFPAACPVRIRLERDYDDAVVYDEMRRPCDAEPRVQLSLPPRGSKSIASGMKVMESFRGDSIPEGTYNVFATIQTEGEKPVVVRAGTITF